MPPSRRAILAGSAAGVLAATNPFSTASATPEPTDSPAFSTFNIISDIQGDLTDFAVALRDIAQTNPNSTGLAIAGDITPRGYDFEYAEVSKVLKANPHPATVAWTIGNHEFYVPKWLTPPQLSQETWPNNTTEDSLFRSFYNFAGRNTVYAEHSFAGVPVLSIGTEKYMHYHDTALWDEVWMSEAQFQWLEDRLHYWRGRRMPVMVISHHPLPNTVSGSHNKLYLSDYLQADRLLQILGRHPDAFLFTGHTHWDLNLSDWYVRRVVPGTANLNGFNVINTGAIQTGWTDNGTGGETSVPGGFNQGLQVEVSPRWVTIKARDYARKEWIEQVRIPRTATV